MPRAFAIALTALLCLGLSDIEAAAKKKPPCKPTLAQCPVEGC